MAVEAYLERIGADRPQRLDLEALARLQERHLDAVPFENLSIHLGEPIVLEEDALVDKLVRRRRGGFCYELNGAFGALLEALGFSVALLAARVFGDDGALGPPYDHLVLRVDLEEAFLVDVGFGAFSRRPLRLACRTPQSDPAGEFEVANVEPGDIGLGEGEPADAEPADAEPADAEPADAEPGDVDVWMNGTQTYRVELRPRALADFEATCWWQQTSPSSHFARSLTCSLPTPAGRVTLSGDRLIRTEGGERTETVLESEGEVLEAYERWFGIRLDRLPVDPPARPSERAADLPDDPAKARHGKSG